jgi:hypothetical protein
MAASPLHADFLKALKDLANARETFKRLAKAKLILGNDNHIGDVGEYWVRRYYELHGQFECYHHNKNGPFDIELNTGKCVSVKTTSEWSESGYGSAVRADGEHWSILAAVLLDKDLYPERLAIVRLQQLVKKEVFVENAAKRSRRKKPTKSYPRFTWCSATSIPRQPFDSDALEYWKLRNDLRRPTMEEIGYRTDVFSLDGIAGSQREYIRWLLGACAADEKEAETILTPEAIDVLASMLRTPLQIQMHLSLALEASYQSGERPVSVELVESVLSRQIDDLEPTLTRHGYSIKDLVEQFDSKAGEIKALFNNTLDPNRTAALREKMLRAGLPI